MEASCLPLLLLPLAAGVTVVVLMRTLRDEEGADVCLGLNTFIRFMRPFLQLSTSCSLLACLASMPSPIMAPVSMHITSTRGLGT